MFDATTPKTAKTRLLSIAAAVAIVGAALSAAPAGNQAQALNFSIQIGPPHHHGHHAAPRHHGVSPRYVHRKLRRSGFHRINRIRRHGHYYTAHAHRRGHHYVVRVGARSGRILNVRHVH